MKLARYLTVGMLVLAVAATSASAHFALQSPPAYSQQDSSGLPQKSAPCGQADPGNPIVPTNIVTSYDAGQTITITIDEKVFHPGHYRVALAKDQSSLPADPAVTAGDTECGSAKIENSSTPGVLIDNMLPHTSAFSSPQSFQVQLPTTTCTNCTLQVIEFMSDHPLNNPGGCFYHHCAQVNLLPPGTPLPDAGMITGGPIGGPVGTPTGPSNNGCAVGGGAGLAAAFAALGLARRRRRHARV